MTTARDYAFDPTGRVASIGAWCPTTDKYDPELAARARDRGDQVWWYTCVVPRYPYANFFLEHAAIEARLLMGAMVAKYRPDGFLYYQISLSQAKEPIRTGPFTNWDPRSYRDAHGDGSWICMREGGLPVPTIRLENYRDGLEDFAYFRILEEAVHRKEGKQDVSAAERQWLADAKKALEIPPTVVTSLTEYSRNPEPLVAWREQLAVLIEAGGERDLNPWPRGFQLNPAFFAE